MMASAGRGTRGARAGRQVRDRWLIAYADMITLLLACFASLYAATLDQVPVKAQASESTAAPVPATTPPPAPVTTPPAHSVSATLRTALERIVKAHGELGAIDVTDDPRGLVISLPEAGSFPTGQAEPSSGAQAVLTEIAAVLAGDGSSIRIEGHTDNVPMRSAAFASNWDLSTARATRVVRFLIEQGGLPPARLSAAGYGEFRPRVPNDSSAARARNRRVDIVVLNEDVRFAEEPAMAAPSGAREKR
jgi:chemotaxis protein MotB